MLYSIFSFSLQFALSAFLSDFCLPFWLSLCPFVLPQLFCWTCFLPLWVDCNLMHFLFWAFLFFENNCHLSLFWAMKSSNCSLFCYLFYRGLVEFNLEKHISVPFLCHDFFLNNFPLFLICLSCDYFGFSDFPVIKASLALWARNAVGIMHFPNSIFGAGHFWFFTIINVCRTILVPPLAGFN